MGKNHRSERLGEEIRKVVSDLLIKGELKDPRFKGMIGVSGVDVSGDGSYATLYITALPFTPGCEFTDKEKQGILDAFSKSQGFIRSNINKAVKVRFVPELRFKFDESFEYGAKMDKLIDSLNIKHDEQVESNNSEN